MQTKHQYRTLCLNFLFALSVLACVTAAPAYAAQKAPTQAAPQQPILGEALVKKMTASGKPSETAVNILALLAGEWQFTAAFWAEPGVEPQRSTGTITNEMILDSRFLSSTVLGTLNVGRHDVLVKGQGLIGYDNAKKSFSSVWVDTMTTGMMIGAGKYDKKANAIKETGQFINPLSGEEERFRSELQFTDADNYKRTIFAIGKSGKESKLMEFDYSRGK